MDIDAVLNAAHKHFSANDGGGEVACLLAKGQALRQEGKHKQAASWVEKAGKIVIVQDEESEGLLLWDLAVNLGGGQALRQWIALAERHAKSLPKEKLQEVWRWIGKNFVDPCNDTYFLEYLGDKLYNVQCYEQATLLYKKVYSLGKQNPEICNVIALSLSYLLRDNEAAFWFQKGEGAFETKEIAYWKARALQFSGQGSQRDINLLMDRWGREWFADASPRPPMPPKSRPLRLGFCALRLGGEGFLNRFVTHLAPALVRRGVEVRLYDLTDTKPGAPSEIPGCQWVQLGKMEPVAKAEKIRHDHLHALIDLDWILSTNMTEFHKFSPAPFVISEIHPLSSHGGTADYLIMNDWFCLPGTAADFSERIVRCREALHFPPPDPRAPPVAPPPCLTQGFITFGSFNRLTKLSEATLTAWFGAIKQVPNARLLLRSASIDDYEKNRVVEILLRLGLSQECFEILGYTEIEDFLSSYGKIDIALDPLHWSGGATSLDALWQGVPLFTYPGHLVASRSGAALLTAIGRPEWIARDLADWQRMVVEAASDYNRLRQWRFELRPQIARSVLCDAERLAESFLGAVAPIVDERYRA